MSDPNRYAAFAAHYNRLMLGGYYDYEAQAASLEPVLPPGASILEIGVGTGLLAKALHDRGFAVSGMDHTQEMLDQAQTLLGDGVPLVQADATTFDLGQTFDVVISNGGVWYGVYDDEGPGHGYCGHLPTEALVSASLERVLAHLGPRGQLVLSLQDRHHDKHMDLPDGVHYEQRITEIPGGGEHVHVIRKEYIFTRDGDRVGYEALNLAYIDAPAFEGPLLAAGFQPPTMTDDRRYLVFRRG